MSLQKFDFIIIGAGIFGLSTAYSLNKRGFSVCVLNEGKVPHPKASSTDISKVIRMEYGKDREYMEMAIASISSWRRWNELLPEAIYHETGFLLLSKADLNHPSQAFEKESLTILNEHGLEVQNLDPETIAKSYPTFNSEIFRNGFYNPLGGYVESGRSLTLIAQYLSQQGVSIKEGHSVMPLSGDAERIDSVMTREQTELAAEHYIFCAGNFTASLLGLEQAFEISGHPIFLLRPSSMTRKDFNSENLPVFSADISNSGWYGFPLDEREQVVKIARHGKGIPVDPFLDDRSVLPEQIADLQAFLRQCMPSLSDAELISSRLCCYTDTADGHFWIDRHPKWENVTVGSGGSGHGFKMGPEVGEMIALTALGQKHPYSDRYLTREFSSHTVQEEQARKK